MLHTDENIQVHVDINWYDVDLSSPTGTSFSVRMIASVDVEQNLDHIVRNLQATKVKRAAISHFPKGL